MNQENPQNDKDTKTPHSSGQLDDKDLEQVAGGAGINPTGGTALKTEWITSLKLDQVDSKK